MGWVAAAMAHEIVSVFSSSRRLFFCLLAAFHPLLGFCNVRENIPDYLLFLFVEREGRNSAFRGAVFV